MDGEAWWATVHGVTKSQTRLSDFTKVLTMGLPRWLSGKRIHLQCRRQEMQVQFPVQEELLEEGMATHSSNFAWRIPETEEPGGLESIG